MSTQTKIASLLDKYVKGSITIEPSTLIDDLKLDSFDLLEFQMAIDEAFGVEVSVEDFLECRDIGDLVVLVDQYCARS